MSKAPDFYVYKLTSDVGGAPCVHRKTLSLAICKPRIRKSAQLGSFIVGIGGNKLGLRLIYIARVTGKLIDGLYYGARCFAGRPDCIYEDVCGAARLRPGARFHQRGDQIKRDVGAHFENSEVLLSDDFRYFGGKGTTHYQDSYPNLYAMIQDLERGHRRNHKPVVYDDLRKLRDEIWKLPRNLAEKPSQEAKNQLLNDDGPIAKCCRKAPTVWCD